MGRTSDARDRLLKSGRELLHDKGYNAVGIKEICDHAGVQKGSFYYFFPSKQRLALDVIDSMWLEARAFLEESLVGEDPPLVRLSRYFDAVYEWHAAAVCDEGCQRGCPLGNLTLELSTQDSLLRDRLAQALDAHVGYLERPLREAIRSGELAADLDPRQAAETILALIEGKILLSKARNDVAPLSDLREVAFRVLGSSSEAAA